MLEALVDEQKIRRIPQKLLTISHQHFMFERRILNHLEVYPTITEKIFYAFGWIRFSDSSTTKFFFEAQIPLKDRGCTKMY